MSPDVSAAAIPDDAGPPGLAAERTQLAWHRSGLALAVAVIAIVRRVVEDVGPVTARTVVGAALAIGLLGWAAASWSAARPRRAGADHVVDATHLRNVTVGTLALAVAALVVAFSPPV